MTTFALRHETKGPVEVITLEGILNADTSPKLEELLNQLAEKTVPYILLNIPDLTYLSSAGIGCFIGVIKKIRNKAGDLRFSNAMPKVKRVFQLLDMADFFKFYPNLEAGITSFSEAA